MKRVLILCTGNSCRSQMAEALWNQLGKEEWQAFSAGSKPAGYVHPLAIKALQEIGLDISGNRSKSLDEYLTQPFDLVITVCGNAREACPVFPRAIKVEHWPFPDPAEATGSQADQMVVFRTVSDQIADAIRKYLNP